MAAEELARVPSLNQTSAERVGTSRVPQVTVTAADVELTGHASTHDFRTR